MSNYSIKFVDGSNYLEHHGVDGQKWGERHGPPYPLNSNPQKQAQLKRDSKSAKREARAEARARKKDAKIKAKEEAQAYKARQKQKTRMVNELAKVDKSIKRDFKKTLKKNTKEVAKEHRGENIRQMFARSVLLNGGAMISASVLGTPIAGLAVGGALAAVDNIVRSWEQSDDAVNRSVDEMYDKYLRDDRTAEAIQQIKSQLESTSTQSKSADERYEKRINEQKAINKDRTKDMDTSDTNAMENRSTALKNLRSSDGMNEIINDISRSGNSHADQDEIKDWIDSAMDGATKIASNNGKDYYTMTVVSDTGLHDIEFDSDGKILYMSFDD